MKVWIVFSGDYEQRGSIGPAFKRKKDAEVFAADFNDGEDIEEFEVHGGTPVRMRHYKCEGWLGDVKNTVHKPTDIVEGFRIYEESWASWDVLVPERPLVCTDQWDGREHDHENYAEVDGRDKGAVRQACIEALKRLHDDLIEHPLNNSTQPDLSHRDLPAGADPHED